MKSVFKKVAGIAIAAAFAVGMAGCTVESDSSSHKHTFATDYSSNATHHWYAATCGHKDQVKDKAEHTFEEWSIRSQPSEDAEGKKERKCSDCQYLAEEAIAKLDHVHAKGTFFEVDPSTCKTKGFIACYACTKSSCNVRLDSDGNPLASIEIELDPSNHESKETTFETIDAENHKEIYKCCNALKIESEPHVWDDGEVTKEPTTTEEGVKTFTCTAAKKILVFCRPGRVEEALGAGATFAGSDEYIEKVKGGWLDFGIVIATPDMMTAVGRLGMVLGRKGLMPNPKSGTVTNDIASAINKLKQGHVVGCGQTKTESIEKLFVPAMVKITGCSTGDFYISNTELTYAKWYEVYQWATSDERGANKYVFQNSGCEGSKEYYGMEPSGNSRQPLTNVSWRDAVVWCNAASEMEGLTPYYYMEGTDDTEFTDNTKVVRIVDGDRFDFDGAAEKAVFNTTSNGYRLPTKIEWEYAAKGGKNYAYSGSGNIDDIAWYSNNSENQTHDVGTKQPNDYGLYDMSGNVEEWCQDNIWPSWSREGYCGLGGNYNSQEEGCTISLSELYGPISPGFIVDFIGFRVVRTAN